MIQESVEQIHLRLKKTFSETPPFNTITLSPSSVSLWSQILFVFATGIYFIEQLMNIFQTEIEATVEKAVPGTASWIRSMVLKFQYGDVAQINPDFSIGYGTIDPTKKIISQCAVVPLTGTGIVNIKAVKENPPVPLSLLEVTALNSYLDTFLPAGMTYNLISVDSDLLNIEAEIFFNGQYAPDMVSGGTVETAITNYIVTLPFNGILRTSDLERVIMAVPGVIDVTFNNLRAKASAGSYIDLILNNTEVNRTYQTYSGSLTIDPSYPLSSTLTYTPSSI